MAAESREGPRDLGTTSTHLRRAMGGSDSDLEWIVAHFAPILLLQVRRRTPAKLKDLVDAEDVLSQSWLAVLPRLGDLSPRESRLVPVFLRFFATTATHVLNNEIRRLMRRGASTGPDSQGVGVVEHLAATVTSVLSRAARSEASRRVAEAIEALSDTDRAVVMMRGVEGQAVKDIASKLGMKPDTVSQRYRRAVAKLSSQLPGSIIDDLVSE